MKYFVSIIVVSLLIILFYIYRANNTVILVEFEKMRPVGDKINVYYNGFKVGNTIGLEPCDHSKNICSKIRLDKSLMLLPRNIEIMLKQKRLEGDKYEDYLEIIYPKLPDYAQLKDYDIIKGKVSAGFHNYLSEEVSYSDMETIKLNLIATTDNLNKATGILVDILNSIDDTVKSASPESKELIKNLNDTVQTTNNLMDKINNSIDENVISGIFYNVENSTNNLNDILYNAKIFTENINSTDENIKGSIQSLNSIAKNIDEIVQGINCTLSKPFGGLRIIFGRTVN